MEDLREFLSALANHWLLLGMAIGALLYSQFGRTDPDKGAVPALILFAICCFLLALYLTVTAPLDAINRPG
jgi:pimeloyl-ACP methyl ester carboxylesterase